MSTSPIVSNRSRLSPGICSSQKRSTSDGLSGKWRLSCELSQLIPCPECPAKFKDLRALRCHFRPMQMMGKRFCCPTCLGMFSSECALRAHRRSHENGVPHVCAECGQQFQCSEDKQTHLSIHRDEVQWSLAWICAACQKYHSSPEALQAHMERIHCDNVHRCAKCDSVYANFESFRKHLVVMHKELTKLINNDQPVFRCRILSCDEVMKNDEEVKAHYIHHVNSPIYLHRCCYCGRLFESSTDVRNHQEMFHSFQSNGNGHLKQCNGSPIAAKSRRTRPPADT